MSDTFTWYPRFGAAVAIEPRARTAKFGDGYQQRVADGINNYPRSWSLSFQLEPVTVTAIEDFFVSHNGVTSFIWIPPSGLTGKWICKSWSRTVEFGLHSIAGTFEEVFGE